MDNITTGHWIFAGIFSLAFIVVLFWSYNKDRNVNRKYYSKSIYFILGVIMILFLLYIFRQYLR